MSHNDITGDRIASKPASEAFREAWDRLFKPAPTCCDAHGNDCRQGRDCPLRAAKVERQVRGEEK